MSDSPKGLAEVLLVAATVGLMGTIVCATGWFLATREEPVSLERLTTGQRQALVEQFFEVSAREYTPTWYEPGLAYTLREGADISAWKAEFSSNELGYRAPPVEKPDGAFRVLFVGDSWAYGMGVAAEDALPARFEAIADRLNPGIDVQAWTLALPSYNSINQAIAVEIFLDRLEPDLVVLCPTRNDNDSNFYVLPNGASRKPTGLYRDRFGSDQGLMYGYRFLTSTRYEERWRTAFGALADTVEALDRRGIPSMLYFLAYWEPEFVHRFLGEAGLEAPFVVGPREVVQPPWRGPAPWFHGTPACYEQLARILYAALAPRISWAPPDVEAELQGALFDRFEPTSREESDRAIRPWFLEVPASYRPEEAEERQCPSSMDCRTGEMGRADTVLIRTAEGVDRLRISVQPLSGQPLLYPLQLEASIPRPDPALSTRASVTVPSARSGPVELLLPIPRDATPDLTLDVELRASRASLTPEFKLLRSVRIAEIVQELGPEETAR